MMHSLSRPALSARRMFSRSGLVALVLAVLSLQALLAPAACAQGTMGSVPDPISAAELDGYAKRLGLSAHQRVALEQFHEQYREAFSALREGEIEKFLNENPLAGGTGGGRGGQGGPGGGRGGRGGQNAGAIGLMLGNVDPETVKDSLRQLETINSKIKSLDNTLFDQIQSLLTEDQILLVPGVRQARERERYRTGVSRMTAFTNPGTTVDLSAMVANLTLTPDERTNVSPLITTYESSLTTAVRKLHDSANQSTLDMVEKVAALIAANQQNAQGGGQGGGQRRGGGGGDAFRQIWGEIMLKMNEKAADITELNRRTERSLNAVLAPPNARKLRDDFFNRAYPENRASSSVSRAFDVAMAFEDLNDEQRAALTAMYDQFRASFDSINIEMADLVDANRKTQSFLNWDDDNRRKYEEQLSDLRDKRNALMDSARAQAVATLGPELTEQLERRVAESRERQREERVSGAMTFVAAGPGGGVAPGAVMRFEGRMEDLSGALADISADPFLPSAISTRDLETYAARLGLDDDQRALLSGLHADYMDQYRMLEDTQIKAVRETEQNLWAEDENGERQPPTPEMIDNLYSLRRQTIESIKQIDGLLFENVQLALLTDANKPALERVQNSRLRSVYNRGAGGQGMFNLGGGGRRGGGGGGGQRAMFVGGLAGGGASSEAAIDLSVLVEQNKITPTDPAQLVISLAEYEVTATAAFQTLFDTSMRVRQATDKVTSQFARGGRGGNMNVQINGDSMRQITEGDGRASREARDAMVNLNRNTLERVTGLLETRSAEELRYAYNRKAYPDVFRDPRSAGPRIDAALALTDLTDSQRDQVQTIAAEFRSAYDGLCNQLIEQERNAPVLGGMPGDGVAFDPQAFQERMRNREKVEFERTDLSDKMLARLRATLSPEQSQRIGLETTG